MQQQQTKPVIAIIGGNGKMGQWFRSFFENRGITVISHGRNTKNSLGSVVEKADIVIVSVPISETVAVIEQVIPSMRPDALLTDLTSLKVLPMKAMKNAISGTLGMHPLFGPSILNPEGQKIVFCHQHDNDYVNMLQEVFEEAGMEVITMAADEHDKQMARIQGLAHVINILLVQTLLQSETMINTKLQTPLFTLQSLIAARVLQQDPHLTADIQLLNPHFHPVLESLLHYTKSLTEKVQSHERDEYIKELQSIQHTMDDLAPYAVRQTNKIIQLLQDKPITLTEVTKPLQYPEALSVAYLGPEGTNTHQAATIVFTHPHTSFIKGDLLDDVFIAVVTEKAEIGVVPAENSLHGTVRETLDLLAESPLRVIGSYDHPIQHNLLSLEKNLSKIKKVISHPQALAQCKIWLSRHLPNAERVVSSSTTAALGSPKSGEAYIASSKAAEIFSIPIVAEQIQDAKDNTTRFYVISKQNILIPSLHRTNTLLFLSIYNRVGILRDILDIFAEEGISLNKLESRPSIEKIWDYCFYIEVDKDEHTDELRLALKKLESLCTTMRVLGRT